MKYTVTLLLAAGTYEEVIIDVDIDTEESWAHFLTNRTVREALYEYANYQVIDIDPDIDFKNLDGVSGTDTIDSLPVHDDASSVVL
jgi:hypothetical protein